MPAYFQATLLQGIDFHHSLFKKGAANNTLRNEKMRQYDVICENAWEACAKVVDKPNQPSQSLFLFLDISL